MEQTREAITQYLAERLCGRAARRNDAHVARCLYRKEVVDGVFRLDKGALLDDVFHFLQEGCNEAKFLRQGSVCYATLALQPRHHFSQDIEASHIRLFPS
jgi:hypothetical protein